MNFLSHFYNEQPLDDPYITAGVILPDILSNYSARSNSVVKVHPARLRDSADAREKAIADGVRRHYTADAWFHESDFFKENTLAMKTAVQQSGLPCFEHKAYAFCHVLLELLLDRKILIEEPGQCERFYTLLLQVDSEPMTAFIRAETEASSPDLVTGHFQHFARVQFIYDYMEDDRLLAILDRINRRFHNPAILGSYDQEVKNLIHKAENALHAQKFPTFRTV
ncbi:MAG: hypothetical protein R2794_02375 [Chitinophagales bacterium]